MRYVSIVLCLLMLSFVGVQYNDPDGGLWMLVYAVPAVWAGLAAARPSLLARPVPRGLLVACLVAALLGIVYYWPDAPRWWTSEVWWEVESAREGMGMMIVAIVLLVLWAGTRGATRAARAGGGHDDERGAGTRPASRPSAEHPSA